MNMNDRCDRCGAQAFVAVAVPACTLLFCVHHYNEHKDYIAKQNYSVTDESDRINKKPSVSSEATS